MQIETKKLNNGNDIQYVDITFTKGKNALIKEGYTACNNPLYFKKENSIIHFNKIMNVWIVETI